MKKICHICVSLLVLSLFISCETPTSSTAARTTTATSSTSSSSTITTSGGTTDTGVTTTPGGTEGAVTTTVTTDVTTEDNLLNKVKGQTYFGIRTWTENEAEKLVEANDPDSDELCDELADRRLALVFSSDGQNAGFADEDDQASAKNNAKSTNYTVKVDGNNKKITLTKGNEKLVLGVHEDGNFLYILEDETKETKPQEVTNAKLDYKYTGLAKDGVENSKEKTSSSDWCPVNPKIPGCPAEFKSS